MTEANKSESLPKSIWADDGFIVIQNEKEILLRIVDDEAPINPRDRDNIGVMVCWHKRDSLGDKHNYSGPQDFLLTLALGKDSDQREDEMTEAYNTDDESYQDPEDTSNEELLAIIRENHVILPLYLYDHSGITVSTRPYHCPWDSGQVGWIYVSKEKVLAERTDLTEENWRETAEQYLQGEVQDFADYITDSVLGYELYEIENNEATDLVYSCYGFYGHSTSSNGLLDQFTVVRPVDVKIVEITETKIIIA